MFVCKGFFGVFNTEVRYMEQYIIKGGSPLVGEVEIGGAKNAALAILATAIMTDETVPESRPFLTSYSAVIYLSTIAWKVPSAFSSATAALTASRSASFPLAKPMA